MQRRLGEGKLLEVTKSRSFGACLDVTHLHKDNTAFSDWMRSSREKRKEKRAQDKALRNPGPESFGDRRYVEEEQEVGEGRFKKVDYAKCL